MWNTSIHTPRWRCGCQIREHYDYINENVTFQANGLGGAGPGDVTEEWWRSHGARGLAREHGLNYFLSYDPTSSSTDPFLMVFCMVINGRGTYWLWLHCYFEVVCKRRFLFCLHFHLISDSLPSRWKPKLKLSINHNNNKNTRYKKSVQHHGSFRASALCISEQGK